MRDTEIFEASATGEALYEPEYPHKPAAQRKRPAAMRTRGRISHWEREDRAGHRMASRGKVGDRTRGSSSGSGLTSRSK